MQGGHSPWGLIHVDGLSEPSGLMTRDITRKPHVIGGIMFEVDFLPVEDSGEAGSKSGDAITLRFTDPAAGRDRVVVIDGGYTSTGSRVADHIERFYGTDYVDLIISTHPDADHLNGLAEVVERLTVAELLLHQPRLHLANASDFSNIEAIDRLLKVASEQGVQVTEPFTGLSRFGGQLTVLGPTEAYYEQMITQHIAEVRSGLAASAMVRKSLAHALASKAYDLLERTISFLPMETLGEDGVTGPRNNTSVITLLQIDGERLLFTGDAGIPALSTAWDEYERRLGSSAASPLDFFQAPHHGSRRNLSPSLLNRIFGEPGEQFFEPVSFISSALNDPKHPSPKVTNALKRRNVSVFATESKILWHSSGAPSRPTFGPATEIGPLDETIDD